jgi:hypothetical protein
VGGFILDFDGQHQRFKSAVRLARRMKRAQLPAPARPRESGDPAQ